MNTLDIIDLGRDCDYQETWDYQESLVKDRQQGTAKDTLLLLEHHPVYTIGRTKDQSSLKAREHLPHPVVEINRGGQGTYHGPGQLVGYLILDLSASHKDLHRHLRNLEQSLIFTLGDLGLEANRRSGLTGVWVKERKIASLGVGVRRWVTLHGFALNVQQKCLTGFEHITPCGIDQVTMTSVETETAQPISMQTVKDRIGHNLQLILQREGLNSGQ